MKWRTKIIIGDATSFDGELLLSLLLHTGTTVALYCASSIITNLNRLSSQFCCCVVFAMSALLRILISVLIFSLSTAENPVEELRNLKNSKSPSNPEKPREKRAIKEHYSDLHCLKQFETSYQTIIRTVESQQNGAVFLNVSTMTSYELCLATCCQTKLCNVAVFDEEGGSCFTFDCGPPIPGEFLCRFTGNEMFTSGALEINRHEFEDSVADARKGHANELANLLDDYTASLGNLFTLIFKFSIQNVNNFFFTDSSLSENQLPAQRPPNRIPEQPSVQTPTKGQSNKSEYLGNAVSSVGTIIVKSALIVKFWLEHE